MGGWRAALRRRTWGFRWVEDGTRGSEKQTWHQGHEGSGVPEALDSLAVPCSAGPRDLAGCMTQ